MTQIEQAGGQYLIQVKENQPKLLEYCRQLEKQQSLAETVDYDSSRGLVCTRAADLPFKCEGVFIYLIFVY